MICLPHHLPLLRIGEHETADYEPEWLEQVLREAAQGAGCPHWAHQRDMAEAVFDWLKRSHVGAVVTLNDLFERLAGALRQTGYPRLAEQLNLTAPPLALHLPEVAADCFGELAFYTRLERRLQPLRTGAVSTLVCSGLAEVALQLAPPPASRRRRKALRTPLMIGCEIRDFIRGRAGLLSGGRAARVWFPGIDSGPEPRVHPAPGACGGT